MKNNIEDITLKGVFTVEMAYIMSVFLLTFFLGVLGLFYFHDKEIVSAGAYETAVVGTVIAREKDGAKEDVLEDFFHDRIAKECIWMRGLSSDVTVEKDKIDVIASAKRRRMNFKIKESGCITEPEKKIRGWRKAESVGKVIIDTVVDQNSSVGVEEEE